MYIKDINEKIKLLERRLLDLIDFLSNDEYSEEYRIKETKKALENIIK